MAVKRARFPRTAYARRAEFLALNLNDWIVSLREVALGPDKSLVDFKTRATAEGRAYAIEHAAKLAEQLADAILAVR